MFNVLFDNGPHEADYFFRKPTFRVQILIGVTSNSLFTVEILLDKLVRPNLMDKEFLSRAWKESVKPNKAPQLRTVNYEIVNMNGFIPLFLDLEDVHLRA